MIPKWCRFGGESLQAVLVSVLLHGGVLTALLVRAEAVTHTPMAAGPLMVTLFRTPASKPQPAPEAASAVPAKTSPRPTTQSAPVKPALQQIAGSPTRTQPKAPAPELPRSEPSAAGLLTAPSAVTANVVEADVRNTHVIASPTAPKASSGQAITTSVEDGATVALSAELAVNCPERPAPLYPSTARRLRETGLVVVKVWLNAKGEVINAQIAQSSGYPRLDQAAIATLQRWRCQAPLQDGHPVPAVALQPFQFALNR